MLTDAQLAQRKSLLTASDAAAVLGLNPWKGPIDVYAEKVGDAPPWRGNWKTRRGHAVEPLLLEWLGEQRAPLRVERAGDVTRVHPIFDWLGATLDGLVFDGADACAVAEAKSTEHGDDWVDEDGDPKVADLYHPQVVVQMAVARLPRAFVVVEVLGEKEPQILEVERDTDLEAIVLEELDGFWRNHVLARVPPPLDDASYRQIAKVFQRPKRAELVPATASAEELAARYMAAREARKAAEAEEEATKAAMCALIGEAEGMHGDTWKATWKWREGGPVSFVREGYRHFDLRVVGAAKVKKGRAA